MYTHTHIHISIRPSCCFFNFFFTHPYKHTDTHMLDLIICSSFSYLTSPTHSSLPHIILSCSFTLSFTFTYTSPHLTCSLFSNTHNTHFSYITPTILSPTPTLTTLPPHSLPPPTPTHPITSLPLTPSPPITLLLLPLPASKSRLYLQL